MATTSRRELERSRFPLSAHNLARFEARITKHESGCWLWERPTPEGYGQINLQGIVVPAHRVAYLQHVGPIPDGLHIDHLCFTRNCVNPEHLEPVTHAENNRRREFPGPTPLTKVHVPADVKADAERWAKVEGVSLSKVVTRMLATYAGVEMRKSRTELLREYARETQ